MPLTHRTLSCRIKRSIPLCLIAVILLILDQRRRSRYVASRFMQLYKDWFAGETTKEYLRQLHASVKALLATHGKQKLQGGESSCTNDNRHFNRVGIDNDIGRRCTGSVDLAIAGAGFKSLYALGAYFALRNAGYSIERVSGASAGAYLAVLLVGNRYQLDDLLEENLLGWCDCCVQAIAECKTICLGGIWSYMSEALVQRLGGWLPEPNTLFLSVTTIDRNGFTEQTATHFCSSADLQETVNASMAIPIVLCSGLAFPWRGQYGIDGGFTNNCPISAFRSGSLKEADLDTDRRRVIVKVDGNGIAGMPFWRKLLHVAYAPSEVAKQMVLAGTQDMLEVLATGKDQVHGITMIRPHRAVEKRDFSYQLLPGKEHVCRLLSGKNLLWN